MNEINPMQTPKTPHPHATDHNAGNGHLARAGQISKSDPVESVQGPAQETPLTVAERGTDRVEVSAAGAALAEASARESAALEASIRIEKVAKIRSDIQNGIYDVDGRLSLIMDDLIDDIAKT